MAQAERGRKLDILEHLLSMELTFEYLLQCKTGKFNARRFDRISRKYRSLTENHWEHLEIRRRCATRQLDIAVQAKFSKKEVLRLFNARHALGFSSLEDEMNQIILLSCGISSRGGQGIVRRRMQALAAKIDTHVTESTHLRRFVAGLLKTKGF